MHFVNRPMVPQPQPSHQQHNDQPVGHVRKRQRIRFGTAIRSLAPRTLRIWAAIAGVRQFDHPLQGDHGASRERHGLPQRPMTDKALTLDWSIPSFDDLRIASGWLHPCLLACCDRTLPLSLSHLSYASFALTVFKDRVLTFGDFDRRT